MSSLNKTLDFNRVQKIDEFVEKLSLSSDKRAVYLEYEPYLKKVTPIDILYLQMYQDVSGQSNQDIIKNAPKYLHLFQSSLERYPWNPNIHIEMQRIITENETLQRSVDEIKSWIEEDRLETSFIEWRNHLQSIFEKKRNYTLYRLFPLMEERLPKKRILSILWQIYDEISALLSKHFSWQGKQEYLTELFFTLGGLLQKEHLIFHPLCSIFLTQKDFDQLSSMIDKNPISSGLPSFFQDEQVSRFSLLMNTMEMSITVIDEHDIVRYYNEPKHRHFMRTPETIGRNVFQCHPQKSVHVVARILKAFREKTKTQARFWIEHSGRKLLITYQPMYDFDGAYRGCVETTQDITEMTKYDGEHRLLDWEEN